ncbi:MAG: protease inhibitor I42 family protein [Candidatus Zixiibacteriota bacterium]|nr:MAG: protease inhibitor I42 family protein [candidate division Zixibacteria bacterium]
MKRATGLSYILTFVCVITIACSGESADPRAYSDPSDTIRVAIGEQFTIVLEANPTTGYSWQFVGEVDSTLLKLVESKHEPMPNPKKLMGRGGHHHWLFEPLREDTTTISLRYLQPWDSTSVDRTVDFFVEIKK